MLLMLLWIHPIVNLFLNDFNDGIVVNVSKYLRSRKIYSFPSPFSNTSQGLRSQEWEFVLSILL